MKKRSHESASPPFSHKKNPNCASNGVRLAGEEGEKKLKDDLEKVLITKDEEEAIATLIALAKMFPNSNKKNGYKCESTEAKSWPLVNDESARETLEVKCSMVQSVLLMTQSVYLKASCPASCNFESEISMIANCKQLATEETAAAMGASVGSLHEGPFQMENCKILGLWPGLSSAVSPGSDTKGSPMNSQGACNSASMSLNVSKTQSSSLKIGTLTDEDSRDLVFRNKSWKRCIAHVHIGRLIKGLQTTEETNNNPTQLLDQLTEIQRLKPDAHVDKSVSKIGFIISAAENDQNETRNANLLHKRLLQDQQQPSPTSTLYTSSNQARSFDFLSMSTGGRGMEATKTVFETGNLIES